MKLRVPDETYKHFSYHYPHVSKQDLELILKRCKPFDEDDYEQPIIPSDKTHLIMINLRDTHMFHVPEDLSKAFNIPSSIMLKRNEEGVIYWIHE